VGVANSMRNFRGIYYGVVLERQPVDCYALEKYSLYPLGNTPCAIDGSGSALACCRVSEGDGDLSEKEKASVFRNILELFGGMDHLGKKAPAEVGPQAFWA